MVSGMVRDKEYTTRLTDILDRRYDIRASALAPARRGYYGETWKVDAGDASYFVKLDYLSRHQELFKNSLAVVEYLSTSGIDFIADVVRTRNGDLDAIFDSAVMGVFEWVDGENVETDETKASEYQMLCEIYPLTKSGFLIHTATFSDEAAVRFREHWERLQHTPDSEANRAVLSTLERHSDLLAHSAARLSRVAMQCQGATDSFHLTHGDAGGNYFVGTNRNYILDWDEVMFAPLERDAWVMCCRDWARRLFDDTLRANAIPYSLRPERLAFYCYHMFFSYLNEFLADMDLRDMSKRIGDYFDNGWIIERVLFADTI